MSKNKNKTFTQGGESKEKKRNEALEAFAAVELIKKLFGDSAKTSVTLNVKSLEVNMIGTSKVKNKIKNQSKSIN